MNQEELSGEMESKIIDAATRVFVDRGRTGASMQNIADEAGINRTLLNYYFRSKDKLFAQVFNRILGGLMTNAIQLMVSEKDIFQKMEEFIELYIRTLLSNPLIPVFVLNELSANPEFLVKLVKSNFSHRVPILYELEEAMKANRIIKCDPLQIIMSLVSMVVFPFAAKPVFSEILQLEDEKVFTNLMEERIKFLKENFIQSIKVRI